jgi:hypothetical protein
LCSKVRLTLPFQASALQAREIRRWLGYDKVNLVGRLRLWLSRRTTEVLYDNIVVQRICRRGGRAPKAIVVGRLKPVPFLLEVPKEAIVPF